MFLFENLEVYKRSLALSEKAIQISRRINEKPIKDQLFRAVLSIPLNIAEGQGRIHPREKKQFYNIARGSVHECVPLIYICRSLGCLNETEYSDIYRNLEEISKMLSGLINYVREN